MVRQHPAPYAIAIARGHALLPTVLPLFAFAREHGEIGVCCLAPERCEELWDVGGIILSVAVQGDDDRGLSRAHPCANGPALAEIPSMGENSDGHLVAQGQKLGRRRIARSVVDENGFVALSGKRARDFARKRHDIAGLIL